MQSKTNRYQRKGPDYPLYPGTYIGQTIMRDGYKIPDRVMIPVPNKRTGKLEFMPMNIERTVRYSFTWYGSDKGWIKTELRPALSKDQPRKQKQPKVAAVPISKPKPKVMIRRRKSGGDERFVR